MYRMRDLAPREVRAILDVLDEGESRFRCTAFRVVRNIIEQAVWDNLFTVIDRINTGLSVHWAVYSMLANTAGDLLESGHYHIWRGELNPMGNDLLQLFDAAVDEGVRLGAIDKDQAQTQKSALRMSIAEVG